MKAKKIIALTMSIAMAVGAASMLAACKDDEDKEPEAPAFVEDKTVYYAVGTSNGEDGSLIANGWDATKVVENLTFVRDTTVTNENVFTLKMKMYEGDAFKILHDFEGDWDAVQINFFNFGEQREGEEADSVVKYDGTTCFVTNGVGNANSNIICAENADGEYTFTLKTFPGTETAPVLSVKKEKSIPRLTKMYLNSDINDFGFASNKADYNMKNNEGNWTCVINVKEEDLCRDAEGKPVTTGAGYVAIQVENLGGDDEVKKFAAEPGTDDVFKKVTLTDEGVVNLLPVGTYVVSYNQTTKAVTISKSTHSMYFIGGFCNWSTGTEECTYKNFKLTANADETIWTGTLALKEATEMKLYNEITGDYYAETEANISLEAGTYFFKFDATTNTVKYEKYEYYLVGSYSDPAWGDGVVDGKSSKLTANEDGTVYSITLELAAGAQVKVVYATALAGANDQSWGWANGENLTTSAAGKYTITYTVETKAMTIAAAAE